ncbi:pilus assembly protein PapC, partial [Vibrio sp. 10N.222.51.A6]
MKSLILYLTLIMTIPAAFAQSWLFPFPVTWGENTIGEVNAYSDGISVGSVNVDQIAQSTKKLINPDTLAALRDFSEEYITVEQLDRMGINATFNSSEQSINLVIDETAAAEFLLSFGSKYEPAQYSESAFWTVQNTLNAST